MLITRVMTQRGGRLALQFWIGVFATLTLGFALLFGSPLSVPALQITWPDSYDVSLIFGIGLLAAISHQMIAHALARAEAALLAPLQYLEIISAVLFGWLIFGDFPDLLTWVGTGIIVAAGIYVFYRERQRARQAMARRQD